MSFLSVLLALFIDRIAWDGAPYRQHHWFKSYTRKIASSPIGNTVFKSGYAGFFLILPVVALVGWLQVSILPSLGSLLEFVFASTLLLFSLGPRDIGRDVEAYLSARDSGDEADADEYMAHIQQNSSDQDPAQSITDGIFQAICWRLIGPVFWFVLFGASGAVAYRLIHLLASVSPGDKDSAQLAKSADMLRKVADWAPARITAGGFAIAGNFDAVISAWKLLSEPTPDDEQSEASRLLIETGRAALGHEEHHGPVQIADSMALIWRNLTLWIVLFGLISLFSRL